MNAQALPAAKEPVELSLDEWLALPEDEDGELVDGLLVEEEMPSFVHEFLMVLLARLFVDWVVPRGGFLAGSDVKYALGTSRGRKPDLSLYLPGSPPPPPTGPISEPPDLVVEILSPTPRDGRRDRVDKVAEYAAFGIRYYWILDPQLRSLEILELGQDGRYSHALGASSGVVESPPGCDGLRVDLDALWAEIDRLEAAAKRP